MQGKLEALIKSALLIVRESLLFSLLIAFLCMFFFFSAKENGLKGSFAKWGKAFKTSWRFRRVFLLSLFTAVVLIQTLFNRFTWGDPLAKVMGDWWFYYNSDGTLCTRPLENVLMLLPFVLLLFMALGDKLMEKVTFGGIFWRSIAMGFGFSLSIETVQLLGRLGTFQISDLVYNTLGGLIGGIIYYIGYKIANRNKKD